MRNAAACALMLIALLAGAARPSEAKGIAVALDDFLVRITTGFSGRQVLLFGATDAPGDVIIVVHGPASKIQVRKKSRVAGIWINRDQVTFDDVPGFYAIASSKPIEEILLPSALANHHIGVGRIQLVPDNPSEPDLADFKNALFRIKQQEGLFAERVGRVTFIGERLFRATISIPSSVPTGTFLIDIFVARDGEIVESEGQQLPLIVSKIGFGADIFDFAHRHSYAYGAIAVLVALVAGWVAHLAFRRR